MKPLTEYDQMKSFMIFSKPLNNAGYPVQDRFGRNFVKHGFHDDYEGF